MKLPSLRSEPEGIHANNLYTLAHSDSNKGLAQKKWLAQEGRNADANDRYDRLNAKERGPCHGRNKK
jgi:hypothetical protein